MKNIGLFNIIIWLIVFSATSSAEAEVDKIPF
jgi:hypothetical protein